MHKRTFPQFSLFTVSTLFILVLAFGCDRNENKPLEVSLEKKVVQESTVPENRNRTLRIAISAVISPKETFILYKDLLQYIGGKMQMEVELIQRDTYAEVNNLVRDNNLDMAFVCSGAYVDGHDQFGMEILVAPVAYGESVYYGYIIVPVNSPAESIADLRGRKFAFTDPMSNTGKLSPTYLLAQMNETPDSFFGETVFTYSHDRSIEIVAHDLVDGAAVDGLIWEYMNIKQPTITKNTKVINKSEPYGIPPIVVPAGMDPVLKDNLRDLLLNIHETEKGRDILAKLMIEKFIVLEDQRYDSIRKMRKWFEK